MSDAKWFCRGKEARANHQPRDLVDGRVGDSSRRAFQAGWDEQHAQMSPPTPEQIARHNQIAADLKKWAKENLSAES
jgi:hypothetical protein